MQYKMISDTDRKILRKARKVLTKLAKKEIRLNAAENAARNDPDKETWPVAKAHWCMLDELDELRLTESIGPKEESKIKIRLTPAGKYADAIAF